MTPIVLLGLHFASLRAELLGAAVIPHGDFAYDPSLVGGKNGSRELHQAAVEVGQWIASLKPDVIVMSTPHGMELTKDFLVYENAQLSGCAVVGDDLHNASHPTYKVCRNMTTDKSTASEILDALGGTKDPEDTIKATGMLGFADSSPLPVGWGEVLPWTYITNITDDAPQVVVLSVPYSRYNHSVEMVPGLLGLGRALAERP
uniref:Extradiol ring-cleavage dioxygenase class III enzyme subunit B domain-containing protein n=1 Tax=Lotharella oceanica TaxID=641309 RepID=A0A7S2TW11_9EUKA|mmetsp:Transcript_32472/g.60411  ORF Transcript_32472/g.60411 Transcript_32472/m.60411 type:complete len:203 (+) Transcript_32472:35-643(+)